MGFIGGLGPGGLDMKGIPEMKRWVLLTMVPRFEGPKTTINPPNHPIWNH